MIRGTDIPTLGASEPPPEPWPAARLAVRAEAPGGELRADRRAPRQGTAGRVILFLFTFALAVLAFLAIWPAPPATSSARPGDRTGPFLNGAAASNTPSGPALQPAARVGRAAGGGSTKPAGRTSRSAATTKTPAVARAGATRNQTTVPAPRSTLDNVKSNAARAWRFVRRLADRAAGAVREMVKDVSSQ
jgi:hypothetical protein